MATGLWPTEGLLMGVSKPGIRGPAQTKHVITHSSTE